MADENAGEKVTEDTQVVALLKEIRDIQRQALDTQIEHRQWLLLRMLLPMFAMVVILVVLTLVAR